MIPITTLHHDMTAASAPCTHNRQFHHTNAAGERGTRWVVLITAITMVVEIAAGWWFNSMALLADGWDMGSHTLAIGVSSLAYLWSRKLAGDARFTFGTWKVEILGGFASAIFMAGVAALMVFESLARMLSPEAIQYREAMAVTVLGLVVNLISAKLLDHAHHHHDHHDHSDRDHAHHHGHGDLNLKAAYLHVLADAATSVFALLALAGGWWLGWAWLDPVMGLVGAALVGVWSIGLLRQTSVVLLDGEMRPDLVAQVTDSLQAASQGEGRLSDLHLWRVGENAYAAAITVDTDHPHLHSADLRQALASCPQIVHATIEVRRASDAAPTDQAAAAAEVERNK